MSKKKTISVCTGIGLNMFFPETTNIIIEVDEDLELRNKYPANVEGSDEFNNINKENT